MKINTYYFSRLLIFIFLATYAACTNNNDKRVAQINYLDSLVNGNTSSGKNIASGKDLPKLTAGFKDSLELEYPEFTKKNCAKFHPEKLYKKIAGSTEDVLNDFTSEAGIDYYYVLYASLLREYNDSALNQSTTQQLRSSMNQLLLNINEAFSCISDGGTMYYHNTQRIPGIIEWYLREGEMNNYPDGKKITWDNIVSLIVQKGLEYQEYYLPENRKNQEAILYCIPPLHHSLDSLESSRKNWILFNADELIREWY